MKEATGEGSLSIVTIVIIAAIVAAAAIVIGMMMRKANDTANATSAGVKNNDATQNAIKDAMEDKKS